MKRTRAFGPGARLAAVISAASLMAGTLTVLTASTAAADPLPTTPPPLLQRNSDVVTSDPIPTVQIDNGYVWSQTTIGSTVYAVGGFENARAPLANPGTSLTPRSNVLAYDINTGALLPFAPQVNGVVKAVAASPDGTRIYIGGSFSSVNGQARWNIAVLDAITGALVPGVSPTIGGSGVYALAVDGTTVYAGGAFTQANGQPRTNMAAFRTSDGAVLGWTPATDRQVDAMVLDPQGQKVVIGGRFSQVNGNTAMRGIVAVDKDAGAVDVSWQLPYTVKNGWSTGSNAGKAGIFGLAADQTGVYGTGWVYANASVGNLEGTFAAEAGTGAVRWIADCLGDHYGVYSTGKVVYTTSHTHACSTVGLHPEQSPRTHRYVEALTVDARGTLPRNPHTGTTYANWEGTPGPSPYGWVPDFLVGRTSGLNQAGLSITGVGNTISIAGEFVAVNNRRFEGIVRFSTNPPGGAKDGPRVSGTSWTPTGQSFVPGRVRVTIQANYDRDDVDLTYELRRSGTSTPVATVTQRGTWWNRPTVLLEDTTATPGESYTYTVVARDSNGNTATSASVPVTASSGVSSAYVNAVLDDNPQLYYPMGDTQQDWAGSNPPVFGSGVTAATPGIAKSSTGRSDFNGSATVGSSAKIAAPTEFTTEVWFRTTTNRGGKLIGYGNLASGNSGSYDRHVYMTNDGRLIFGVYPGGVRTIQSGAGYNNGQWHHVVASQSSAGMRLYVDGQLVASDASVTTAEGYTGYWRVGGDSLGSWVSVPTSHYFAGSIDEVAVYPYALSLSQVRNHYGIGMGLEAPTATFVSNATDLSVAFDASGSTAAGAASIASYSWDFGDGSPTQTGATVSHLYSAGGTRTVTLTVVDSNGLSATHQQEITVLAPNQLPTAAFEVTASGMSVTADASESTDSDGTIASYVWTWGDGTTSEGQVASHAYTSTGHHTVTLTVTDDRGGVHSTSQEIEATHADPVARFEFEASGLTVNVEGSASSASDGATLSYAWNWGDGSPAGSGATASHTYAESGNYTIMLTVTDNLGASHSVSHETDVTAEVFSASDTYSRVVGSGWGSADIGGVWTPWSGSAAVASVSGGTGRLDLAPGGTREMALQSVTPTDSVSTMTYTLTAGPSTGASYVGLGARRTEAGRYQALAWHRENGTTTLLIRRDKDAIATLPLAGGAWTAGSSFQLKMEVTGTAPTTIRMKLWTAGTAEPGSWQLSATDLTAGLQAGGAPFVFQSRPSTAVGSAPVLVDDFTMKDLAGPVVPNVPPVASFTPTVTGKSVSVNASASTDSDGTIASYAWTFGDGGTGSGVTASHTYATANTYVVTLTVTDDDGATHSTTRSVVIEDEPVVPDPDDPFAEDTFNRVATSGWGTASTGGAWTISGGAASAASVADNQGRFDLAPGGTRYAVLGTTSVVDSVVETEFQVSSATETGGAYVGVVARQTGSERYLVRAWLRPDGTVWLVIHEGKNLVATRSLSGMTYADDTVYHLKVSVTGMSPTTISAKFWADGSAEPGWQLTSVDSAAALQGAGSVGLTAARPASSTGNVQVGFRSFSAA